MASELIAKDSLAEFKRVAYFASWSVYQSDFKLDNVPAQKLSHLIYAFAKIEKDAEISLFDPNADVIKPYGPDVPELEYRGNLARLYALRSRFPSLSIMVSLGGWTGSAWFSDIAADEALRKKFAQSARQFVDTYHLDGLDIDWEYPVSGGISSNSRSPADAANLVLLLAELRAALDQAPLREKKLQLSIALSPNLRHIAYLDLKQIAQHCDFINLMAYNYLVGGPKIAHQASLFPDINASVRAVLAQGIEPYKLVLGLPAFARSWYKAEPAMEFNQEKNKTVEQKKALLLQGMAAATVVPKGNRGGNAFDYRGMSELKENGAIIVRQDQKSSPFLIDENSRLYLSFDDYQSTRSKKKWAQKLGLGGMMIWELSADRDFVLLDAIDSP